jgi:DNA-binding response OmpR family regulator
MHVADVGVVVEEPQQDQLFGSEGASPLLLLVDSDPIRRTGRAAELRRACARVAELGEVSRIASALQVTEVDAVVICADDPARCQEMVHVARSQINCAEYAVPLIAWQTAPNGPCGSRAFVLQLGADTVLEAPSSATELLASAYALRRLIRNVHMAG